jgi:hypothetical protein
MTVIDLETQLAKAKELVSIATQAYSEAHKNFDHWKEMDEKVKRNNPVGPFNQPFYEAHTRLNDSNRELNEKKARMAVIQDKLNELKQSQNESSAEFQQTPHKLRRWLFPAKALRNDVMTDSISQAQYAVRAEEYNMWVGNNTLWAGCDSKRAFRFGTEFDGFLKNLTYFHLVSEVVTKSVEELSYCCSCVMSPGCKHEIFFGLSYKQNKWKMHEDLTRLTRRARRLTKAQMNKPNAR